jgi:O-antigen/teichoic acid export membrane protein
LSTADQEKRRRLISRAATGITWSGLGIASQRITQTLVVIILARLLAPEDFGLVALATMAINTMEKIKGLGMASALIHRRNKIEEAANVLFYFNMMISSLMYALIYCFAPQIAIFFDSASAELVLRLMALQLFADIGITVPRALAVKKMQFKKLTLINFSGSIVGGFLSLLLAVTGWGVWALVYGTLVGVFFNMVLWLLLSKWKPGVVLDWQVMKEMIGFGVRLSVADIMDGAIDTCNRIFIGRFLGLISLGLYDVTLKIVQLPFKNIILAGNRVALPTFCELQDDRDEIKRWYLKMIGYSSLLMAPLSVCLIFLANLVVPVVLGEKWIPVIPYLRLLGAAIFFLPLLYTRPVYIGSGRADLLLQFTSLRFLITVPLLLYAAQISLFAVCLAEIAALAVFSVLNQWVVIRMIGVSVNQLLQTIKPPLAGAGMISLTLVTGNFLLGCTTVPNILALLIMLLSAVFSYLLLLHLCYPVKLQEVIRLAAISVNRPQRSP